MPFIKDWDWESRRIRDVLYKSIQYNDEILKKKIIDLNENDACFVRELISQQLFDFETGINKTTSEEKGNFEEILKSLPYLYTNGQIRKLDLGNWFTYLLPFWMRRIIESKRSYGLSKDEIVADINRFVSHNIIAPDEIDPCGNIKEDLPIWYSDIIPESIGLLSKLKYLELGGNHLNKLPESIKNLKNLRELHLGFNLLKNLPDWLADLPKLRRLEVSNNPLQTVPKCVIILAEKHYTLFHTEVPHEEAIVLGILEILSRRKLYKIDDSQVPDGDNAQNYRINEDGHISHIFIWEESILFEFFPEQLCELVHLEELHIEPTAIIKLPESLSKLKKLRILSLSNFYEYIGRSEELSIPESIFPFLRKLKDFSFDSDLLKKLGLKE